MTRRVTGIAVAPLLLGGALFAQQPQGSPKATKEPKPYNAPPVFSAAKPVEFVITANFKQLKRDRGTTTPYRPGIVTYAGDSGTVNIPTRLRTRGIFRKKTCDIPPLLMNFNKDSTKKTLFARLDRVRLTMHCKDNDKYEQYVLQEFNLYRVHRLLTPYSYDVRLARVAYVDQEKKDTLTKRWAFLQEQDDVFAERLGVKLITVHGAGPDDLQPYESAFFGVFQYFVANTDYSIRELHNVVLVMKGLDYIPVARDFDWGGAVNTEYAKPNSVLPIRTVTTRLMRGYCAPAEEYQKVFALFREKKDAIYALYHDEIGSLIDPKVTAETLKYFDDFYQIINDPKKAQREIVGACLKGSA